MKLSKILRKVIIRFTVLVLLVGVCWGGLYAYFHSMASLPHGEFIGESTSPQGTYTVRLYYTDPALSSGGTRGELIINDTNRKRNLYWEYNRYLFEERFVLGSDITGKDIEWEDDDTVIINGVRLNLPNETYDWRRDR